MSYEEWVKYAEEDLEFAKYSFKIGKYRYTCYFSQQAVEKLLKAFLIKNKIKIPKTHDILELLDKCIEIDRDFEELYKLDLEKLSLFYTLTRYPEFEYEVTEKDAKEAIEIAEKVREFVLKKLK